MAELFKYLAARYPETLTRVIIRTLDETGQDHAYDGACRMNAGT